MGIKEFPKRGEICLVCLDPTVGSEISKTRPALIISNDISNRLSKTVSVIPITSQINKIAPFETYIPKEESGLSKDSKAKCNQIRTVDKSRLIKKLGIISPKIMKKIESSLKIHLDMNWI